MKYCEEYAALLDLYVDGELSPGEMAAVQEHLDQCPDLSLIHISEPTRH